MNSRTIASIRIKPLTIPMSEPFEISTGAQTQVENVLIAVRLADGTTGYGECAPMPVVSGETQASAMRAAKRVANFLIGKDAGQWLAISRDLETRLAGHGSVRAGLEMAVLDAWARQIRIPLRVFFGGVSSEVRTDITVPIMPPGPAAAAARKIWARGARVIKIKVGKSLEDDVERVLAVADAAPKAELIVDANGGYDAGTASKFLARIGRRGIRPIAFEQPVDRRDWDAMARLYRTSRVPIAADETVSSRADAWRLARKPCAHIVNLKLMKYGIAEALDVARICRAAGLGLMIGGMIESYLAMTCAAHFAAGLGGFQIVDLDTPLWFSRNPMKGVEIGPRGTYDLAGVRSGIGVFPGPS